MSRLASSFQRASRGSSRGISYYNMKGSAPLNAASSKKETKYYDNKLLKNSTPSYSSALKSSIKQRNGNQYDYKSDRDKQKQNLANEADLKRQGKQRNNNFRIRTNTKEQTISSSIKNSRDDDQRQKQMEESLKRQETLKLQRQKKEIQKLNLLYKESQAKKQEDYKRKIQIPDQLLTPKTFGLVGLNNIGNTCYMNSILQCMFNLPGFNQYFIQGKHVSEMKNSARVAQSYAKTIKLIRSSTSRSETPSEIKSAVGSKKSRFMGCSQQDAQEFLVALLELLSFDLNRSKNPKYKELTADTTKHSLSEISDQWWNYNKQREDSIVCDYFTGQILSKVVCCRCNNESIAFDNIWDMSLNFTTHDNGQILKMIKNFFKEQTITNDYYCSKCKTFRECIRKIDFFRLPKILVLQIKRFSYGRWRKVKLNNRVRIPAQLDLSPVIRYREHPSVETPEYSLVGVVNHSGDIDFGHYTAQCKNPLNKKWYNFNDSHVSQTRMREQMESSSPYLLFYAMKQ